MCNFGIFGYYFVYFIVKLETHLLENICNIVNIVLVGPTLYNCISWGLMCITILLKFLFFGIAFILLRNKAFLEGIPFGDSPLSLYLVICLSLVLFWLMTSSWWYVLIFLIWLIKWYGELIAALCIIIHVNMLYWESFGAIILSCILNQSSQNHKFRCFQSFE